MKEVMFEGKPYLVSFDSMPESLRVRLGDQSLTTYLDLLQKVQHKPREVYQEVKAFSEKYADVPEVINLLTFAHIQNHRISDAEKLIETTFHKHPDYLFARINYADQCVRRRKLEKVAELFPTFDLHELCPEKKVFHTSEYRGFLIMMAHYFRARNDQGKAFHYYEAAKEVEPTHPSVAYLEKKLFKKSLLRRLFQALKKRD